MKPRLEIISKALYICHENANSLLEEADLLYRANKYPRAYFLAQIAIEEIGKISMLIASVQYPAQYSEFWKSFWKLFRSHSFKIGKAEISFQNSMLNFQLNKDNKVFKIAEIDNQMKMNSLYVDVKGNDINNPREIIDKRMAKRKTDEAKKKFSVFQKRKSKEVYKFDTLKLIDSFYSEPEIRKLQKAALIDRSISPSTYLKELFKIARNYPDEPLVKLFTELASMITED